MSDRVFMIFRLHVGIFLTVWEISFFHLITVVAWVIVVVTSTDDSVFYRRLVPTNAYSVGVEHRRKQLIRAESSCVLLYWYCKKESLNCAGQ